MGHLATVRRLAFGACALWAFAILAYAVGWFAGGAPLPSGLAAALFLMTAAAPAGLTAVSLAVLDHARGGGGGVGSDRLAARLAAIEAAAGADGPAAKALRADLRKLADRVGRVEAALSSGSAAQKEAEAPASPAPPRRRPDPAMRAAPQAQPALPFAEEAVAAARGRPVSWTDVVAALDFPRDEADAAGMAALASAVRDPEIAQLLQAAEDVLAILAGFGAHMEDLRPEPPSLDAWRAYAEGARGARAAAVGGVHDDDALAAVRARLRADGIFRDACFVLARRWGRLVVRFFEELGDDPLMLALADTRSGRAFMLTARAMGAFD